MDIVNYFKKFVSTMNPALEKGEVLDDKGIKFQYKKEDIHPCEVDFSELLN